MSNEEVRKINGPLQWSRRCPGPALVFSCPRRAAANSSPGSRSLLIPSSSLNPSTPPAPTPPTALFQTSLPCSFCVVFLFLFLFSTPVHAIQIRRGAFVLTGQVRPVAVGSLIGSSAQVLDANWGLKELRETRDSVTRGRLRRERGRKGAEREV